MPTKPRVHVSARLQTGEMGLLPPIESSSADQSSCALRSSSIVSSTDASASRLPRSSQQEKMLALRKPLVFVLIIQSHAYQTDDLFPDAVAFLGHGIFSFAAPGLQPV
jgi:hypothetical protein